MLKIFIDADACPVKQEVYRVARRHGLDVTVVANSWMRVPNGKRVVLEVVKEEFDAADDWIVDHIGCDDIVISGDIPLASRCIEKGAHVLGPSGKPFTEENIGQVLATRNLLAELRDAGDVSGGPAPFNKRDRSRFLDQLDRIIRAIQDIGNTT